MHMYICSTNPTTHILRGFLRCTSNQTVSFNDTTDYWATVTLGLANTCEMVNLVLGYELGAVGTLFRPHCPFPQFRIHHQIDHLILVHQSRWQCWTAADLSRTGCTHVMQKGRDWHVMQKGRWIWSVKSCDITNPIVFSLLRILF
jgi:hypothetical protein